MQSIDARPGISRGQDIFFSFRRGEISFDDYLTHSAIFISDTAHEFQPRKTPPAHSVVLEYARGRINGVTDYSEQDAKRLGIWFHRTMWNHRENEHDESLLRWAISKLEEKKLSVDALQQALWRFQQITVPAADLQTAVNCKKLDAMAREKGK